MSQRPLVEGLSDNEENDDNDVDGEGVVDDAAVLRSLEDEDLEKMYSEEEIPGLPLLQSVAATGLVTSDISHIAQMIEVESVAALSPSLPGIPHGKEFVSSHEDDNENGSNDDESVEGSNDDGEESKSDTSDEEEVHTLGKQREFITLL